MNICIFTYLTFKNISNGNCLKHEKGRHSYVSVCYQAYVTRMHPYVTMYPKYYPYDNNNNNNFFFFLNTNNNYEKHQKVK